MTKRTLFTTIIIPVFLISGLIVVVLVNNRQAASGGLRLQQQMVDFETLAEWDGAVTRSLLAENTGRRPIRIQNVQISCGYVHIRIPDIIDPGTEVELQVRVIPEEMSDSETAAGVILFTDSPETPTVHLTVHAAVERFAALQPNVCDFGEVDPEQSYQQRIILVLNAPLDPGDIRLLPTGYASLTWDIAAGSDSGTRHINVRLHPVKANGLFSSLLTLAFPNERTLTLPVIARYPEK